MASAIYAFHWGEFTALISDLISFPSDEVKTTNEACTGIYELNNFDKVLYEKTLFSWKSCSIY